MKPAATVGMAARSAYSASGGGVGACILGAVAIYAKKVVSVFLRLSVCSYACQCVLTLVSVFLRLSVCSYACQCVIVPSIERV
jgi:hypothetical protein